MSELSGPTQPRWRVLKLGGSLLGWSGVRDALNVWRELHPHERDLLIVGGGAAADWVREADRVHQLGEEASHWLAIRAMELSAHIATELWPSARFVSRFHEVTSQSPSSHEPTILFPWEFLRWDEPALPGAPLPHAWDVTSDSIAARVALTMSAAELVLFKSALPPAGANLASAAESGYVDAHFPVAAADLALIRAVDLRSSKYTAVVLHRAD